MRLHSSILLKNGVKVSSFTDYNQQSFEMTPRMNWTVSEIDDLARAKFIPYGHDNAHPLRLREAEKRSLMHSNIITIASNLIDGNLTFKLKDKEGDLSDADKKLIKEADAQYQVANIKATSEQRAHELYTYGYAPILVKNQVGATPNGGRISVSQRDAIDFRLGRHYNTFFGKKCEKHYYHYKWDEVSPDGEFGSVKVLNPNAYYKQKRIDYRKVLEVPVIEAEMATAQKAGVFSYLIGLSKKCNKYYPRPFFESDVFWHKLFGEYELATVERNGVKNGLRADYIITIFRRIYDNPEGDLSNEQVQAQKRIDLRRVQEEYAGYVNSGNTQINFMGITHEGGTNESDGNMKIDPIPNNNNFKEIGERQQSLDRYIRSAHALTVPELAGLNDSKSGFSNLAEYIRVGAEVYINNVIKPHIKKIDEFYNTIINPMLNLKNIETQTETRVVAINSLIAEFKEMLTVNEFRQKILNMGPLDDSEKENLIGQQANKNKATNTDSVDKEMINRIALSVHAKVNENA